MCKCKILNFGIFGVVSSKYGTHASSLPGFFRCRIGIVHWRIVLLEAHVGIDHFSIENLKNTTSDWWFGTMEFDDVPYIWNNHPNWLSYFSEGLKPPTRHVFIMFLGWTSITNYSTSSFGTVEHQCHLTAMWLRDGGGHSTLVQRAVHQSAGLVCKISLKYANTINWRIQIRTIDCFNTEKQINPNNNRNEFENLNSIFRSWNMLELCSKKQWCPGTQGKNIHPETSQVVPDSFDIYQSYFMSISWHVNTKYPKMVAVLCCKELC